MQQYIKHKGHLWLLIASAVFILLLALACVYVFVSNIMPGNKLSSSVSTGNSDIDAILKGVDYTLLDSTIGSACSKSRDTCYWGTTMFFKMQYPVPDSFKKVVANLDRNKWLLDNGETVGSILNSDTVAGSNTATDGELIFKETGADKNYGYYTSLNGAYFGVNQTLYRGSQGVYFFAFSKAELQTNQEPYYNLQAGLSVGNLYDFGKLLSQLDKDSFILSITLGKKQ